MLSVTRLVFSRSMSDSFSKQEENREKQKTPISSINITLSHFIFIKIMKVF